MNSFLSKAWFHQGWYTESFLFLFGTVYFLISFLATLCACSSNSLSFIYNYMKSQINLIKKKKKMAWRCGGIESLGHFSTYSRSILSMQYFSPLSQKESCAWHFVMEIKKKKASDFITFLLFHCTLPISFSKLDFWSSFRQQYYYMERGDIEGLLKEKKEKRNSVEKC